MYNQLKVVTKSKKRVGRGVGSGKGFHTTGRGQKGQKARYTVGILFEGVKTKKSLLHRLPMLPGKQRFKAQAKPTSVSIAKLNLIPAGDVTIETLIQHGFVNKKDKGRGAKIVGIGEVTNKYVLHVAASKSVSEAVTKAGGTIA